MKLINQLLKLILLGTIVIACEGQANSKGNDSQSGIAINNPPPEIPERLKRIDKVSKQVYHLQRELRELRIEEFIEDINKSCKSLKCSKIEFILHQESGELIQYLVDGKKIEIDCIRERLNIVHGNFGEMSFGYSNAFRIRPKSQFIIVPSKVK